MHADAVGYHNWLPAMHEPMSTQCGPFPHEPRIQRHGSKGSSSLDQWAGWSGRKHLHRGLLRYYTSSCRFPKHPEPVDVRAARWRRRAGCEVGLVYFDEVDQYDPGARLRHRFGGGPERCTFITLRREGR